MQGERQDVDFPVAKKNNVVMCEIQGAQEDFARRWERCFSDYPDLLTDAENKEQVQKYMERAIAYLQTVKARLDGGATH